MSHDAPAPTTTFAQLSHYGGFDWAKDKHHLAVVDPSGKVLLELPFHHTAEGWETVRQKIAAFPKLGVAIETSCGPAVEHLLDLGATIFPMNPKAAQRYRDRKRPSGGKSDPLDGWCFADALRTDGHAWRPLIPQDPLTDELRMLCRDEIQFIEQRTALVNQLQAALYEYYPAALEAFDDWTLPAAWDFVLAFPTPQKLADAGKRKWQNFLHVNKLYRPQTANARLEAFAKALQFVNPNPAVTNAKSLMAITLARQLRIVQAQLDEYRSRIEKLFAQHPDHEIFESLPGAGDKLAPRLLAEIGAQREQFDDAIALQSYAGVVPATHQSGKSCWNRIRWACNKHLRSAAHLWVDLSRRYCAWADIYYKKKKRGGMAHATALRCLAARWFKIISKMWKDHTVYDEATHTRNQVNHGSWIIDLLPPDHAKQPVPIPA